MVRRGARARDNAENSASTNVLFRVRSGNSLAPVIIRTKENDLSSGIPSKNLSRSENDCIKEISRCWRRGKEASGITAGLWYGRRTVLKSIIVTVGMYNACSGPAWSGHAVLEMPVARLMNSGGNLSMTSILWNYQWVCCRLSLGWGAPTGAIGLGEVGSISRDHGLTLTPEQCDIHWTIRRNGGFATCELL